MGLLSPWSLAWLGLLVPLVLLYILKRRRERKVVGSTILWEAALRDMRAERPWQRLRPHLSLLLQALVLIAGAIALSRPAGAGQVPSGARLAVIVDASSSMAAEDEDGSRMERARAIARSLARDLPEGGTMMIVAAAGEPEVLSAPTADRVRLEAALDRLRVRGPESDLEAAVALAAERLRDAADGSRIVVLTDAAFAGNILLAASVPVEVSRVGGELVNHGIVALDVRPSPTTDAPDRAEVFVRVARYGAGEGEVRISASIEGGDLVATRRLTLGDGEPEGAVIPVDLPPDAAARGSFVRVELQSLEGGRDPFPLDDIAVAPSPAARRLPVFLVGDAPASVRRVLSADPEVELYASDLSALAGRDESAPALDGFFVYVGDTPAGAPGGDSLVLDPSGDDVFGVELGEAVATPNIVTWDEADERMRFVRFTNVHLGAVRPILGSSARSLLTTDAGTAIAVMARPDGETTLVSFDIEHGDWTTQPSYVVFFRNLLERARQRRAAGGVPPGALGTPLRVPVPEGERVTVTSPSGARLVASSRGGVAIVDVPAEPGVFRVEVGARELYAIRNLSDPEESDLGPRATFTRRDGSTSVATVEPTEHLEAWPWIVALLLLLLAIEVFWGTRREATS